jgi:hypothetical protein
MQQKPLTGIDVSPKMEEKRINLERLQRNVRKDILKRKSNLKNDERLELYAVSVLAALLEPTNPSAVDERY